MGHPSLTTAFFSTPLSLFSTPLLSERLLTESVLLRASSALFCLRKSRRSPRLKICLTLPSLCLFSPRSVLYNYIDNRTKFWFVCWFGLIGESRFER